MSEEQNIPGEQSDHSSAHPPEEMAANTNENRPPDPEAAFQNVQNDEGIHPSAVNLAAELAGLHPSIKQMELHHPLAPHKKKLKDYFFEFFMLFVAITLGFFVENKREHMTENKREKQFIRSLVEDLRVDTVKINYMMGYNYGAMAGLDSLISIIYEYKKNDTAAIRKMYHWYVYYARNSFTVNFTDRTISQLKNSGNMRLIEDQIVSDSIIDYDDGVKLTTAQGNIYKEKCEKAMDLSATIFDYRYLRFNAASPNSSLSPLYSNKLLTDDPMVLSRYANLLELWKQVISVYITDTYVQKNKGISLISYLKKEYDLK